jgi:CBS domain-containing protein
MSKVRDVMTTGATAVGPGMPLKDVARLLLARGISGVPVVGADGEVLGVVSEGDFLVKERGSGAVAHRPLSALFGESRETRAQLAKVAATTAGEAMSTPAVTIDADRPVTEAAALMAEHRIKRLPVTEGGRLVGIVTRADLLRAYARTDEELAATIRDDVLYRTLWLDPRQFEVAVQDGLVHIAGSVDRRSTAEMIERIASLVPGTVGVSTEIRWELDDRDLQAPPADYVSSYKAPRTH